MDKDSNNKRLLLHNPLVNGLFWGCLAATIVFMAIACAIAAPYDTFASFLDVKTAFLANVRFRVYLSLSIVAAFGWLTVLVITAVDNIIQLYFKRPQVSTQQEGIVPDEIATTEERCKTSPEGSTDISTSQSQSDEEELTSDKNKLQGLFVDTWPESDAFCDAIFTNKTLFIHNVDYGRLLVTIVKKHPEYVNNSFKKGGKMKIYSNANVNYTSLLTAYYNALGVNLPSPNLSHYEITDLSAELRDTFKLFLE